MQVKIGTSLHQSWTGNISTMCSAFMLTSLSARDCFAPNPLLQITSYSQPNWSHNYVTTDCQSASLSWCWHTFEAHEQIFIIVSQLRFYWCGAPSLTRGWVCSLQQLLGLASSIILRFESRRTHYHILFSQIWDSPILWAQISVIFIPQERGSPV
jgi:hypothetical protein